MSDFLSEENGHEFVLGWEESDRPHPGFGGSTNIYGGYCEQCQKCGMYGYEYEDQKCGPQIRSTK